MARLMAELDLVGVHSRKKWRRGASTWLRPRTCSSATSAPSRPNERWGADITEFTTGEGKLFLAGVKDLYGRGLVGWSMGTRQTSELVIEAVSMAVARRDPVIPPLHHSDKGCQYTSLDFTNRLHELGLVPSYGSTGDCYDNGASPRRMFRLSMATGRRVRPSEGSRLGARRFLEQARLRRHVFAEVDRHGASSATAGRAQSLSRRRHSEGGSLAVCRARTRSCPSVTPPLGRRDSGSRRRAGRSRRG